MFVFGTIAGIRTVIEKSISSSDEMFDSFAIAGLDGLRSVLGVTYY